MSKRLELPPTVLKKLYGVQLAIGKQSLIKDKEALLVWQYVRANPRYQEEYDKFKKSTDNPHKEDNRDFCTRWRMSSPLDYKNPVIQDGFHFIKLSAFKIDFFEDEESERLLNATLFEFRNQQMGWQNRLGHTPIVFVVDRMASPEVALNEIKFQLCNDKIRAEFFSSVDYLRIRGSAKGNLLQNIICFYSHEVEGKGVAKVKKDLKTFANMNVNLQSHQLRKRIDTFKKWSMESPDIFFRTPN